MLSNRIQQFRLYNEIEAEFLAKVLNIDTEEYLKYESGELIPDISVITELAKLYKVTVPEFYGNNPRLALHSESTADFFNDDDQKILKFSELSFDEKELIMAYRLAEDKESFLKLIDKKEK
ncbi:MAG: helix-turn-helix transcriptional regulator [Clostridia bacterium]|nr:helix-turn-helix transcriptional regulator [Clostridia bacterium]